MNRSFQELLHLLRHAASPEDIFGVLPTDGDAALKRRYRELVAIAHPDHNQARPLEANEAFRTLREWYQAASQRLTRGVYGAQPLFSAVTCLNHYAAYGAPERGDLCDLFGADATGGRVLLKVARHARDNDLLQAEARALRQVDRALASAPLRAHFPTLVEHFLLRDEAGAKRQVNVLRAETGYVSLADVLRAYPNGLHPADAAWMFNRILAALGGAHQLGMVHGALVPEHVLIRPDDHNGMLLDWCYCVPIGTPIKAISPPYAADYPPEVVAKQPATPATDLYLAARCMARLLGGNGRTLALPETVPRAIEALLRSCLIPSVYRRACDAWQVLDDFHEILGRYYGPPRFRPFHMPY